jgi:hypothetical protein
MDCVNKQNLIFYRDWPALASIIIGALIYIVYGADTLLINKLLRMLHLGGILDSLREIVPDRFSQIRNQVPDGLWVFAGTNVLVNKWQNESSAGRFWVISPLLLGITGELGQLIQQVPGTFDILDILSMLTGCILGYGVGKKQSVTQTISSGDNRFMCTRGR